MSSWDMKSLLTSLEAEAGMALDYMAVNKLVANTEKTKFLLIRGKRHNKWPEVKIKVGNPLVNESQSEKILGVTVNNNLMWKEQHSNIANTLMACSSSLDDSSPSARHVFVLASSSGHRAQWGK
jgi:hypothetical protein